MVLIFCIAVGTFSALMLFVLFAAGYDAWEAKKHSKLLKESFDRERDNAN